MRLLYHGLRRNSPRKYDLGDHMITLNVLELLYKKGKTKYWLYKNMDMTYQNLSKMLNNETASIKYDNIERLCELLHCTPNDLFLKK